MSLEVECVFIAVSNISQENLHFCFEISLELWDLNW